MENLYDITVNGKKANEQPLSLKECLDIKREIEAKRAAIVIIELFNKPKAFDFIDIT